MWKPFDSSNRPTWDLCVVEDWAGEDAADVGDAALGRQPHRHRLASGVPLQRHLQFPLNGRRPGLVLLLLAVAVHHRHVEELS